jgi:hypothetical protein
MSDTVLLDRAKKVQAYQTAYKEKNKEKQSAYMKAYVATSPTISCACGGKFKAYCAYKHIKTSKHLFFLSKMENKDKDQISLEIVSTPEATPEPVPFTETIIGNNIFLK